MNNQEQPILTLKGFSKQFGNGCKECTDKNALSNNYCSFCQTVYACQNIDLELYKGEILGIVGESGSGKSTLIKSLYFDIDGVEGNYSILADDIAVNNIFELSMQKKLELKNNYLSMVYQNPLMGLRMKYTSLANIAEKMIAAKYRNVDEMIKRGKDLLNKVEISTARIKEPPINFSGGMQQRVQIAKALSNDPPLIFLDEVTTGLDLSVQVEVLELIRYVQREFQVSMILVSHDLAVIRMLANRTIVMLNGRVVESGLTDQILEDPQHPYTQKLVYSLL